MVLGANDKYIGLCRRHWRAGDLGPDFNGKGTRLMICNSGPAAAGWSERGQGGGVRHARLAGGGTGHAAPVGKSHV